MDERGGPLDGRDAAWDDGEVLAVVLDGARTGGRLAVLLLRLAAGTAQPRHRHQREDETLYVLDGTVHVRVRGRSHPLPAGSGLFVPRGHVHAYATAAPATVLALFSPAGFGDYFAERAAAGPWSVERLIALAARYGCTITGPAPGPSDTRRGALAAWRTE